MGFSQYLLYWAKVSRSMPDDCTKDVKADGLRLLDSREILKKFQPRHLKPLRKYRLPKSNGANRDIATDGSTLMRPTA
jgi:hypothetical protein